MSRLYDGYVRRLPADASPGQKAYARDFCEFVGNRVPTAEDVNAWIDAKREAGYAPGSLRMMFGVARRVFTANGLEWPFAHGAGPVVGDRDLHIPRLSPAVIEAMIRASARLTAEHRAYLALATTYGPRRAELASIAAPDVDVEHRLLYIETKKFGRQRYHRIPEEILPVLRAHRWPPEPQGRRYARSATAITEMFHTLRRVAGLRDDLRWTEVGWHAIRRAVDRALIDGGLKEAEVQVFLRWKRSSNNMTRTYFETREIGLEEGADRQVVADEEIDHKAFLANPWLATWAEVVAELEAHGREGA